MKTYSVEVRPGWKDPEKVSSIRLPFTAEQLIDICNKEGELLPSCCANISSARDIIIGSLREGGWIDGEELAVLVQLISEHDGFEHLADLEKADPEDPFVKLARAWEELHGDLTTTDRAPDAKDPTSLRDAINVLSTKCSELWMRNIMRPRPSRDEDYRDDEKSRAERHAYEAEVKYSHEVNMSLALMQVLPALKTVYTQISELYPEPVEGWTALLKQRMWQGKKEPSTDPLAHGIIQTGGGFAIYETQDALEGAIKIWEEQRPTIREDIEIRRIKVSAEAGIELLD